MCPLYAASPQSTLSLYRDDGEKLFTEEKPGLAISRFVHALLIDPSDPIARKYLKKIAKTDDTQIKRQGLYLLRFVELSDFSRFLRSRIKYLDDSNAMLVNLILKTEKSDHAIIRAVQSIQSDIRGMKSSPGMGTDIWSHRDFTSLKFQGDPAKGGPKGDSARAKRVPIWNPDPSPAEIDLKKLNENMIARKQKLMGHLASLRYINAQLRPLRIKVIRNIRALKRKESSQRIAELTGGLAKISLELYEKSKLLGDKAQHVAMIKDNLADAHERLNLGQRIIQEKDEHIVVLEEEIASLQSVAMEEGFPARSGSNLARIQSLEQQFQSLNKKYLRVEEKIKERDSLISQLKKTVVLKNKKIVAIKTVSLSSDRKVTQLNGIVQIYRGKLKDTYTNLVQEKERIHRLEEQLLEMEGRLNVRRGGRYQGLSYQIPRSFPYPAWQAGLAGIGEGEYE